MVDIEKTEGKIEANEWIQKTSKRTSFALGMYDVKATPLIGPVIEEKSIEIPLKNASCFLVKLIVKSPYPEQAELENFEGLLEDRWGLLYHMAWNVDSFENDSPVSESISGATGSEVQWHNSGVLCAYGDVSFRDYFDLKVYPRKPSFPFYGVSAHFTWDFDGVDFGPDHPSKNLAPRKREVQRYKGW